MDHEDDPGLLDDMDEDNLLDDDEDLIGDENNVEQQLDDNLDSLLEIEKKVSIDKSLLTNSLIEEAKEEGFEFPDEEEEIENKEILETCLPDEFEDSDTEDFLAFKFINLYDLNLVFLIA